MPNDAAREVVAADAVTRAAGLGANSVDEEQVILKNFLADARSQFAGLGIELPLFPAGALGEL